MGSNCCTLLRRVSFSVLCCNLTKVYFLFCIRVKEVRKLRLVVGIHNLTVLNPGAVRIGVRSMHMHPRYNANIYDYDYCLLQLDLVR